MGIISANMSALRVAYESYHLAVVNNYGQFCRREEKITYTVTDKQDERRPKYQLVMLVNDPVFFWRNWRVIRAKHPGPFSRHRNYRERHVSKQKGQYL